MNKKEYIRALDNITAPEELLKKIEALDPPARKKRPLWKTLTAVAACFIAVLFAFSGLMGGVLKAESDDKAIGNYYNGGSYSDLEDTAEHSQSLTDSSGSTVSINRKIVKNAVISVKTKNYDAFMADINKKTEQYGGYIERSQEYNYNNDVNRNANMHIRIPADKLDIFIEDISSSGVITSKTITSEDITDSYIDVESRINALETEEKTLLGILERAENLSDVIELQERLSSVRAELERLKAQKLSYDGMVACSGVDIDIHEVERVIESDDTFFGEVKKKLMNNLYDLADFFRDAAIDFIAALPYIVILAVLAAVVVIIVKAVRKRRK